MPKSWERPPSGSLGSENMKRVWMGYGVLGGTAKGWTACWKPFCLGKLVNRGSPSLLPACSFFFRISWMINWPHKTVVKPLVSHVTASKYPDAWHQWRKGKIAVGWTEFVTFLPNVFVLLRQWLQSLVSKWYSCICCFIKGLSSEVFSPKGLGNLHF